MNEIDNRKPCIYFNDYKRCPEVSRHFICTTALYRHCGTYQLLSRQDRFRERRHKTIENCEFSNPRKSTGLALQGLASDIEELADSIIYRAEKGEKI